LSVNRKRIVCNPDEKDPRLLGSKWSDRYSKRGLPVLKRAVKRTATGKALAKWRADLIRDLGGDVSTQEFAIIDLAVKSKLTLDSIDVWLLTQESLINKRKKGLLPVVKERQALADGLARYSAVIPADSKHRSSSGQRYCSPTCRMRSRSRSS
jgi:hypothetical protein